MSQKAFLCLGFGKKRFEVLGFTPAKTNMDPKKWWFPTGISQNPGLYSSLAKWTLNTWMSRYKLQVGRWLSAVSNCFPGATLCFFTKSSTKWNIHLLRTPPSSPTSFKERWGSTISSWRFQLIRKVLAKLDHFPRDRGEIRYEVTFRKISVTRKKIRGALDIQGHLLRFGILNPQKNRPKTPQEVWLHGCLGWGFLFHWIIGQSGFVWSNLGGWIFVLQCHGGM